MKILKRYSLATVLFLVMYQISLSQTSIQIYADAYLSHRYGRSYGVGIKQQFSNNVFGLGITMNNLTCFAQDSSLIGLGCTSSTGIGYKFTVHKILKSKIFSDRVFYGLRTDLQFLEDVYIAPMEDPVETNTMVYMMLAELGYSIPLPKGFMIQGILSLGYNSHSLTDWPVTSLVSINLSKTMINRSDK